VHFETSPSIVRWVAYLAVDMQDTHDRMMSANKEWEKYSYERVCQTLGSKFPGHMVMLLAPARMCRYDRDSLTQTICGNLIASFRGDVLS
jgi:hypothetical protein